MELPPHVVLFPFMAKGHTIPLLHLARLLLRHHPITALTIFTTPANRPFIAATLSDALDCHDISIISLPFPSTIPEIPPGVESTDKLPSMSLLHTFMKSTEVLQPPFEEALQALSNVKLLISDGFFPWTLKSANKFSIPRLVYYGMSYYAMGASRSSAQHRIFSGPEHDDEPVTVPDFPWIKLTRNDMSHPHNMREPSGPDFDMVMELVIATSMSHGLLVNSFYELEPAFADHYDANPAPRAWSVGPFCLAEPEKNVHDEEDDHQKPGWMKWLNQKLEEGETVLYIAFGSQAEVSTEQLKEITVGLEKSDVNFLWVVRPTEEQKEIIDGFRKRVEDKGLVVSEWVDQRAALGHEAVQGFLSHCGWNSVTESICAGVPILAWPMMAEQHLNARMVVEEIKMGLRVETSNGSVKGFVKAEGLEKPVKELMEGETGKKVRQKAKEVGEAAKKAMDEGGSSWLALESLLDEFGIPKPAKKAEQ